MYKGHKSLEDEKLNGFSSSGMTMSKEENDKDQMRAITIADPLTTVRSC